MAFRAKLRNAQQTLAGRMNQRIGRNTGNRRLERKGKTDRIMGNVKQSGEKGKDAFRR